MHHITLQNFADELNANEKEMELVRLSNLISVAVVERSNEKYFTHAFFDRAMQQGDNGATATGSLFAKIYLTTPDKPIDESIQADNTVRFCLLTQPPIPNMENTIVASLMNNETENPAGSAVFAFLGHEKSYQRIVDSTYNYLVDGTLPTGGKNETKGH